MEYFLPAQPREAKRQKLARMGQRLGDVRCCQHLRLAKISGQLAAYTVQ